MTALSSLLVPCSFDPTLWTDAELGRMVHRAAQHLCQREAEDAAAVLAEIPEDLPSDLAMARLICELWLLNQKRETDSAVELFERKLAIIDPSAPLGAYAQYQGAIALVRSNRSEEALDLLAIVEYTLREFDEHIALGLACGVVGGALSNLGDMRASVNYFAASYDELSAHGTARQIVGASLNLVFAYAVIGRHEDALRIAESVYGQFTDETEISERSVLYGRLEYCCELLGRYEESLKWNAIHRELARQHQQHELLICLEVDHAFFLLRLKRFDEAQQILASIPDAATIAIPHFKVRWAWACGLLAHEHGNTEKALEAFTEAVEHCQLNGITDEPRLRVFDEIIQLSQTEDGLPRADFAAPYLDYLKKRLRHVDHVSSNVLDAHARYAARLAQYRLERDEQLHTTILESGEQSRREIAIAIHDGAGQELAVTGMQLDAALRELPADHPAREYVEQARHRVTDTARELRTLSHALGTRNLERDGLPTAVYNLASDVRSNSRIGVTCFIDESLEHIQIDLAQSIYRTVQTLVSNTLRHAYATNLEISITLEGQLIRVGVTDDGVGADAARVEEGMGWRSIRARVELRGGTFTVDTKPGAGTSAVATFAYSGNA